MAHKVNFFDVEESPDEDGWIRPERVVETDDGEEAVRLLTEELARTRSISAASLGVDWRLCADLSEYLRLTNAAGRWLQENSIAGSWIGCLTEDLEHWAGYGVHTPEQMAKHEIINTYSDYHKAVCGVRPRGMGWTLETPIEELEAAWDRLAERDAKNEPEGMEP